MKNTTDSADRARQSGTRYLMASSLLCLLAAFVLAGCKPRLKVDRPGMAASATSEIATAIQGFQIEYSRVPNGDAAEILRVLAAMEPGDAKQNPRLIQFVDSGMVNRTDPWSQPYRIQCRSTDSGGYDIRVWSCGPNGKDENGAGDDILMAKKI